MGSSFLRESPRCLLQLQGSALCPGRLGTSSCQQGPQPGCQVHGGHGREASPAREPLLCREVSSRDEVSQGKWNLPDLHTSLLSGSPGYAGCEAGKLCLPLPKMLHAIGNCSGLVSKPGARRIPSRFGDGRQKEAPELHTRHSPQGGNPAGAGFVQLVLFATATP